MTFFQFTISGVDDNGAGVAAMLEVIRQITDTNKKGTKRGNTIIFASFLCAKVVNDIFSVYNRMCIHCSTTREVTTTLIVM
jgi:hypothetical protein